MIRLLRSLRRSRDKQRDAASNRDSDPWALHKTLISVGPDDITIGRAVEGTLIFGATGSGKTSGSGQLLARSYLDAGFSGLVLCAKSEERRIWEKYCAECSRLDDLVIFGPGQPWRFNALDYELHREGAGAGLTENIVNLLSAILELAERNSSQGGGKEDEGYWKRALKQLLRNLVDLLVMAKGSVSVPELYRLVVSAPTSLDQVRSEEWRKRSFCFQCLIEGERREKSPREEHDFGIVADYFMLEFPGLSDKTRSIVVSTCTSMVDVLNRGILRELFCGETNITPKDIEDGKIIVVDLPVKEFGDVGQFAAAIWKYCFMRSIERRDVRQSPRVAFLWEDEAQNFTMSYDMQFQATCRSARVAVVALSQNISNFYATLGDGQKGRALADSLFGNLNLKIFHANGDAVTNQWASEMIGKSRQYMANANNSYSPTDVWSALTGSGPAQTSAGVSEQMQFELEPSVFTQLRTGGAANKFIVDAIMFCNGVNFKTTGRPWMPVTFNQRQ